MVQLIMPKMGESVAEATILKWLKKEGDRIEADEPVLEIATDKVDTEVPSPAAGILSKRLFEEGQVVKVGEIIAMITAEGESASAPVPSVPVPAAVPVRESTPVASNGKASSAPVPASTEPLSKSSASGRFYSPLVRNIAKQEGMSMAELETISGSGMNNRVTKTDILQHLDQRGHGGSAVTATPPPQKVAPVSA
ncbi:MAG TPA: E3 binding domain-containing protein, partial [Bacteroidia bacterium]|nr:E3 binding domain-containing protein [Bacteroidia bacterium]